MEINFENTIKKLGEINKVIYGINPYENLQDKLDLERRSDLEELEIAEQEVKDEQEAYNHADEDFGKAIEWRNLRKRNLEIAQSRLQAIKNRE